MSTQDTDEAGDVVEDVVEDLGQHGGEDERKKGHEEPLFSRVARDRFSGALNSALDRADFASASSSELLEGIPDLTAGLDSPLKRIINSCSPWSSPSKSPRSARRRRKKEPQSETAFHHTFVLKLFDRSVNLAQFEENSVLYPVCRAWIKDQPHNKNFAPRRRSPTPQPDEGHQEGEENDLTNGRTEDGAVSPPKKDRSEKSVYKMPPFQPLPLGDDGQERVLRLPQRGASPQKRDFRMEDIQLPETTPAELLSSHRDSWHLVRASWKDACRENESRYKASLALLHGMFDL